MSVKQLRVIFRWLRRKARRQNRQPRPGPRPSLASQPHYPGPCSPTPTPPLSSEMSTEIVTEDTVRAPENKHELSDTVTMRIKMLRMQEVPFPHCYNDMLPELISQDDAFLNMPVLLTVTPDHVRLTHQGTGEMLLETTVEDLKCHFIEYTHPCFLAYIYKVKPCSDRKFVCVCLETCDGMSGADLYHLLSGVRDVYWYRQEMLDIMNAIRVQQELVQVERPKNPLPPYAEGECSNAQHSEQQVSVVDLEDMAEIEANPTAILTRPCDTRSVSPTVDEMQQRACEVHATAEESGPSTSNMPAAENECVAPRKRKKLAKGIMLKALKACSSKKKAAVKVVRMLIL